jgi:hypothetical protein
MAGAAAASEVISGRREISEAGPDQWLGCKVHRRAGRKPGQSFHGMARTIPLPRSANPPPQLDPRSGIVQGPGLSTAKIVPLSCIAAISIAIRFPSGGAPFALDPDILVLRTPVLGLLYTLHMRQGGAT